MNRTHWKDWRSTWLVCFVAWTVCSGCTTPQPDRPPSRIEAGYAARQHNGLDAPQGEALPAMRSLVAVEIHDNFGDCARISERARRELGAWMERVQCSLAPDSPPTDDVPHGLWVMSSLIGPLDPRHTDVFLHDFMSSQDSSVLANLVQRIRERCEDYGAVVVNNSWGMRAGVYDDATSRNLFATYEAQIEELLGEFPRLVVVFAAGNEGPAEAGYPQRMFDGSPALVVGASRPDGRTAQFTSWSDAVDVTAHGQTVMVLDEDGEWIKVDGTSFAAPHLAGLAARFLGAFPEATGADFVAWLDLQRDPDLEYSSPVVGYGDTSNFRQRYAAPDFGPSWMQRNVLLRVQRTRPVDLPTPGIVRGAIP